MARQSRREIEKAYRAVYNIDESKALKKKDDDIMFHAAPKICNWQGFLPGEVDPEDVVKNREMDKKAATSEISDLCNYFKKLGIYKNGKTNWWNVFSVYKEFIETDPTGVNHPINIAVEDDSEETDLTREEHLTESESEMLKTDTTEATPLYKNKTNNIKEEPTMGETQTTVGEAMGATGTGLKAMADGAAEGANNILNMTGKTTINTGVGTPSKDEAQKAAEKHAQETEAARKEYTKKNKISELHISQEPLDKRIPKDITTGKVSDPVAKRSTILTKVWSGESLPEGYVNGKVNGEWVIPKSVSSINQTNEYKTFMDELEKACLDPTHEVTIRRSNKLGAFNGITFFEDGKERTIKWKEAKDLVYAKTTCQLYLDGSEDTLVQLGKARRQDGKKIESNSDLLVLNVINKSSLIDVENGTVKDPTHVTFVYKTTDKQVDDKSGVRSALGFKYLKKAASNDANAKDRITPVNLMLQVPQYDTELSNEKYSPLKVSRGVGHTVTKLDSEGAASMMNELFTQAIITGTAKGDLEAAVQTVQAETVSSDAEKAAAMAGAGKF